MTITSVTAPVSGLNKYSMNSRPSSQGDATGVTLVTEASPVLLSPEARHLSAQSTQASQAMNTDVIASSPNQAQEKEDSSWFEDALDSLIPDASDDKEDACPSTMNKYLKAAVSIGSVIALFV
ncbi:hypothetical protein [Shewanella sp.]|uniref:hypothetical protein n=1 Tax=Shewanella sp. TaxID=50422 RepID=UPI001EBBAD80|nr:hypothetical protein [Shewanella sp.]NRB24176.1 hypothetical protein [Shewanella sp.]